MDTGKQLEEIAKEIINERIDQYLDNIFTIKNPIGFLNSPKLVTDEEHAQAHRPPLMDLRSDNYAEDSEDYEGHPDEWEAYPVASRWPIPFADHDLTMEWYKENL